MTFPGHNRLMDIAVGNLDPFDTLDLEHVFNQVYMKLLEVICRKGVFQVLGPENLSPPIQVIFFDVFSCDLEILLFKLTIVVNRDCNTHK